VFASPGIARQHPLFERELRFTHRINSRAALRQFLASNANVAEGDICWGQYREGAVKQRAVIMAHPPLWRSDLKLAHWIDALADAGRAVKLDLKDPAAIAPAVSLLAGRVPPEHTIVNVDAVRGPRAPAPKFDRRHLQQIAEGIPGAVISIGATSRPWSGGFTAEHIDAFLELAASVDAPITCALRLSIVDAAPDAIAPLHSAGLHVTIWNSALSNPATAATRDRLREQLPGVWLDLSY
jgi:hypothetical protein